MSSLNDKKKKLALLLRELADGFSLEAAARKIDLPIESAKKALLWVADQYDPKVDVLPLHKSNSGKGTDFIAYTDGGARGNPGPAGAGVSLLDSAGVEIGSEAKYLGHSTNNEAEYAALILALEIAVQYDAKTLEIRSDSKLLVEQMKGKYKVKAKNLVPLVVKAKQLENNFTSVRYVHIPRERNKRADALVNEAIDREA